MTKSPYWPAVASAVMPSQALESIPHTVPNSEPMSSFVTVSEGTHVKDATMDSHVAVLGVGGRASAAAQPPLPVTAGQSRGVSAVAATEFMVVVVVTSPTAFT